MEDWGRSGPVYKSPGDSGTALVGGSGDFKLGSAELPGRNAWFPQFQELPRIPASCHNPRSSAPESAILRLGPALDWRASVARRPYRGASGLPDTALGLSCRAFDLRKKFGEFGITVGHDYLLVVLVAQ